jgi:hypothetical protein
MSVVKFQGSVDPENCITSKTSFGTITNPLGGNIDAF